MEREREGPPPALRSTHAALRDAVQTPSAQIAMIVAVALLLRLGWVLYSQWEPMFDDDAYRYDFTARALVQGLGYIHPEGHATAFWPPGYSLLIAALYLVFGERVIAAEMLNVVLGTGIVLLVYLFGRRMSGHATGVAAAALVAFWPSLIFFSGVTLSETAFTFLALLGLYMVTSHAPPARQTLLLLLAGAIIGFAALTRGQALLLPLVAVPYYLATGVGWPMIGRKLGLITIGIAVVIVPWTVRNAIELDEPVLISTNAGVDFWIGHHDGASGDFGTLGGEPLVFRHPELGPMAREVRVNREGFREGFEYALTHPLNELALPFKKFFWLYYNDEEGLKWNDGHGAQEAFAAGLRGPLLALSNVYYFSVVALFTMGVKHWWSRREPWSLLFVTLITYWTVVHLVFFGDPRFHAPIMPAVALLTAVAWFPGPKQPLAGEPH